MDTRTRCLDILCMMLLVYPVAVPSIISNMLYNYIKHNHQKQKNAFWLFSVFNFAIILLLILIQPSYGRFLSVTKYFRFDSWILIGFVLAPLLIVLEFGVGALIVKLQKKRIERFAVDEQIGKEQKWIQVAVLIVAVMEELFFRGIGHYIIIQQMGLSLASYLLFTALIYAINHVHEGIITATQKLFTGFMLGLLFVLSESLLVPIAAHVAENILIMVWSKKSYE